MEPSIQQRKEHSVAVGELDPIMQIALQHDQLLSKRSILRLQPARRLEKRNQKIEEQG
jgi:hypothetical protein